MRHLFRALARQTDPLSDAALLDRYRRDRDPAAFEVLVWRYGGMVLGVCRRHLRDAHLAEDAFQATFLVLARQAATVRGDTLAGFLHRVARRTAVRAAIRATRRRETPLAAEPAAKPVADPELAAVLDAEIDRLPDRLRQVVVLCYLDGRSTEDAAARLGVPRGTVLSRLHTARAKLVSRLTRRGVTPPAVGLAAGLTAETVAGGVRAASGGVSAATILANEVLTMSARKTVLAVAAGLVLAGGAGTGVGVLSAQPAAKPAAPGGPPAPVAAPAGRPPAEPAEQQKGDQLKRLHLAVRQVEDKLAEVQEDVKHLTKDASRQLDPAALRAALLRLDEQILSLRFPLTAPSERNLGARRQPNRPDFDNLTEAEVNELIDSLPEMASAVAAVRVLRDRSRQPFGNDADDARSKALEEQTRAAVAKLDEMRKPLREKAIRVARESWEATEKSEQRRAVADQTARDRRADVLTEHRDRLAQQVAQAGDRAAALRRLADEERLLAEVRAALTRQRLALELGVSVPAAGTGAADALTERFDQLDRQLAELKATLSAQDGSSRLDAIERKLEQVRTSPGLQRR